MTYIIITEQDTVAGPRFSSYQAAFAEARRMFGDSVQRWMELNLRIEEAH